MENLKIELVKILMNALNRLEKGASIGNIKKDIANIYDKFVIYDYLNANSKLNQGLGESDLKIRESKSSFPYSIDNSSKRDDLRGSTFLNKKVIEIDINDKIAFIGYLFGGSEEKFDNFISKIKNNINSFEDANYYISQNISINKYDKEQSDTLNRFIRQIEKNFN